MTIGAPKPPGISAESSEIMRPVCEKLVAQSGALMGLPHRLEAPSVAFSAVKIARSGALPRPAAPAARRASLVTLAASITP